jgi:UDP-2,4-diacetamido-2,4,6-trideoxy-beta-L-altropyranose hydrolase
MNFLKSIIRKSYEKNSVAIILGGNDVLNLSSKIADLLLEINNKYKITVL